MIPKKIHQIWIGSNPRPKWMQTWPLMNPDFDYVVWDDERVSKTRFETQALIDAMPDVRGKADIMRYEILRDHGGVYIDADSECITPIDDCLLLEDVLLRAQGFECWAAFESESARPGLVANGHLGAIAGCNLFVDIVRHLLARGKVWLPAWQSVGPAFMTQVVGDSPFRETMLIYPSWAFVPVHYTGSSSPIPDGVVGYADHHWGDAGSVYAAEPTEPKSPPEAAHA